MVKGLVQGPPRIKFDTEYGNLKLQVRHPEMGIEINLSINKYDAEKLKEYIEYNLL